MHFFWGALTVALVYPLIGTAPRLWLKQRWSRQLLEILAVRLEATDPPVAGCLFVSNHVSWLDIFALNALRPMAFVAKSEVRTWPFIGWLSAATDTLFLSRERRRHAGEINAAMRRALAAGKDLAYFPEGTTSDGSCVLAFHGALLQSAIDASCSVQPVALSYRDAEGNPSRAPAYAGETTMAESLAAILACRRLSVRLCVTPPIESAGRSRGELAEIARRAIVECLEAEAAHGDGAEGIGA